MVSKVLRIMWGRITGKKNQRSRKYMLVNYRKLFKVLI